MIAVWQQVTAAFSTEIAALSLLDRSGSELRLLSYFTLHALAAAITTAVAWLLLPSRLKQQPWQAQALIFSFGFFIPGLGIVAVLAVVHIAIRFPKAISTDRYVEIEPPKFMATEKEARVKSDLRAGHARRILADPRQDIDIKLRVLIALQDMRPKVAIPMLQGLLSDPAEDIRLLAYSMMDAWEKDITQRVQLAQDQLAALAEPVKTEGREEQSGAVLFNLHRRLAELFWEQVDTKLARGDLRAFALQQSKKHCEQALKFDPNAAGVWLLFGEVLIQLGQPELAYRSLKLARGCGGDEVAIYRAVAQQAFLLHDFIKVREYMERIEASSRVPYGLRQISRFWAGKSVDVVV